MFGICRLWNVKFQISTFGILLGKVLEHALILAFLIEMRIMRQAILQSAAKRDIHINLAVGFSHYAPVDGAWLVMIRRPMILNSITHHSYLLGRKNPVQHLIGTHYLPRHYVMTLSPFHQPGVVKGSYGIHHILIYIIMFCQTQTLIHHISHMIYAMRCIKCLIARNYLALYVFLQFSIHTAKVTKNSHSQQLARPSPAFRKKNA